MNCSKRGHEGFCLKCVQALGLREMCADCQDLLRRNKAEYDRLIVETEADMDFNKGGK